MDRRIEAYLTFYKCLQHQVFPGGPPSKYYPGPTMLNFRDQTRTGAFIVVWSWASTRSKSVKCIKLFNLNFHATSSVFLGKGRSRKTIRCVQTKNIKLHIVTDIKVGFSFMLGIRISSFGRGEGYFYIPKKMRE